MNETDEFAQWDAAYVLGALSGSDRARFEEHLESCARCRAAVAQLAGMPGLLAQVSPAEALAMGTPVEPAATPPATLMPELPTEPAPVVPLRRRRRWVTPVAAAAAALLIGGVGGYAASQWGSSGGGAPGGPSTTLAHRSRVAFTPVVDSRMTAVVDIVPVSNGTEFRVECQYAREGSGTGSTSPRPPHQGDGGYSPKYALWVLDRAGEATQLRDWTAEPDEIVHPVAVSSLTLSQIGSLEIRQVDSGRTVLRADLS